MTLIAQLRKEIEEHGGKLVADGVGGYDMLAPTGRKWNSLEVWCQPIPLTECASPEERREMIQDAIEAAKCGLDVLLEAP